MDDLTVVLLPRLSTSEVEREEEDDEEIFEEEEEDDEEEVEKDPAPLTDDKSLSFV